MFTQIPQTYDKEILRLTLGEDGPNSKQIEFDLEHRISSRPLKKTKQILANMALEDLLGKDYLDLADYSVEGNNDDDDTASEEDDSTTDDDDSSTDDEEFDLGPISGAGYSWEVCIISFSTSK